MPVMRYLAKALFLAVALGTAFPPCAGEAASETAENEAAQMTPGVPLRPVPRPKAGQGSPGPSRETPHKGNPPEPARPGPDGIVIGARNLLWVPAAARYLALMDLENAGARGRLFGPRLERTAALYLNRLAAQGRAAGLSGVLYDNRDRGHSRLSPELFPQLTPVIYGDDLEKRGLDYGLAESILFPAITLGNSSTAITAGRQPRSLPRLAMTRPGGALRALQTYAANHIYVYPEHRDHDATDRFPANWPYMLISQGSSGSDRPFLEVVALILASFTPETRARLEAEHLVAAAVQMVFRRAQTTVRSRAAYLSGAAHPTAFDKSAINPTRMMALAQSLAPETIPPQVVLQVESEDFRPRAGLAGRSERLFDTPAAIARIWRGLEWEREMVVSAAQTKDPNDRPLTFIWVLLRGDPERVRIVPLDESGSRARITVNWQDERQIVPGDPRTSSRVDIGVFADNGAHLSAPAFVSVSFPTHQKRRYAPVSDGGMRLVEIDYDAAARKTAFDPALHWTAPWQDRFRYGADGSLVGWERRLRDKVLHFTAGGKLRGGVPVAYELTPRSEMKMRVGKATGD